MLHFQLSRQIIRVLVEALFPLALEFAWRRSSMTLDDFAGQAVIFVALFYFWHAEVPDEFDDDHCVRRVKNGNLDYEVASNRIPCAKQSGWGPFKELTISDRSIAAIPIRSLSIPQSTSDCEIPKAQILNWIEHPRGIGPDTTAC